MPATIDKVIGRIQVEMGTTETGDIKTKAINLGDMSESYFRTDESAANTDLLEIVQLLAPCLTKTISAVETVTTKTITM